MLIPKHELRPVSQPDVVDANEVGSTAGKAEVIERVKFNVVDVLIVHEFVMDPWLASVADLQIVFDSCKQISFRVWQPADSIDVIVNTLELKLWFKNSLRVWVADELADDLLFKQVEVISRLLSLAEGRVEVPDKEAALIRLAGATFVASSDQVTGN